MDITNPLKTGSDPIYFRIVSSFCSTSDIRHATRVNNPRRPHNTTKQSQSGDLSQPVALWNSCCSIIYFRYCVLWLISYSFNNLILVWTVFLNHRDSVFLLKVHFHICELDVVSLSYREIWISRIYVEFYPRPIVTEDKCHTKCILWYEFKI